MSRPAGLRLLLLVVLLLLTARGQARPRDPLPSWAEGPSKRAITTFVEAVSTPGSPQFVPPAERIATFAPIAALLLGVSDVLVPWDTLVTAVGLFVVVPLAAGWLTRALLRSPGRIERLEHRLKPLAILSLIATVLLLFLVQAGAILANPLAIVLIAIPLILQTYLIFWITAQWMRLWRQPQAIAAPGAMIGASNFFELAVAVAISLFGLNSGAALATVVGVLVEVPVMLSLVAIANRNRRLFPTGAG